MIMGLMGEGRTEKVGVDGTPAGIHTALNAFGEFSQAQSLPDDLRRLMQLVLDEVLSNVVRHGLAGRDGRIRLRFELAPGVLAVEVEDDAPAFNPLTLPLPDTTSPLEARQPGGLGVALVTRLVDDVQYERRQSRNHLRITKRFRADGPADRLSEGE